MTKLYTCLMAILLVMGIGRHASADTSLNQPRASLLIQTEEGSNPWSHLHLNNDPQNFQFAIVTDRTGGHREGVFADAIRKLNLLQPEFVMSMGDLIEGYTDDEPELKRQWAEFNGFIDALKMPFFYVSGNHDISNDVMAQVWQATHGRTYYHFVYRNVLFLCLNSEEPIRGSRRGAIGEAQFLYVKKVLEAHPDVRWTLVFLHRPLWTRATHAGYWDSLEYLLRSRKHTVFAGHHHRYVKYERQQGKYFVLSTTGGGSQLRGPNFGELDHVVWVTMTDDGPIVANLMLQGIWDENIVDENWKAFMQPFMRGAPVKLFPPLVKPSGFDQALVKLQLTNDKNIPMQGILTFHASDDLQVDRQQVNLTVPPNMVETVSVRLTKYGATPIAEVKPVHVDIQVVLEPGNRPLLRVTSRHALKPVVFHALARSATPPTIDGQLDEWPHLPFDVTQPGQVTRQVEAHTGPQDARFRFGVQYDADFIYVGIDVVDDRLVNKPDAEIWRQDSVTVRLDARPLSQSIHGRGRGRFRRYLYIAIGPGQPPAGDNIRYRFHRLPFGTRAVARPTSAGYAVEMAIPVRYLEDKQNGDWQHFRLNVSVDDNDHRGQIARLWWQPAWHTEANIVGSGMFRKP